MSISSFMELMRAMLSVVTHVPRIEQPRDARFRAIARPIPREAPVMTATLSVRSCSRIRREAIIERTFDSELNLYVELLGLESVGTRCVKQPCC